MCHSKICGAKFHTCLLHGSLWTGAWSKARAFLMQKEQVVVKPKKWGPFAGGVLRKR